MADEQSKGNTWTRQITADGAFARQPTGFRAEIDPRPMRCTRPSLGATTSMCRWPVHGHTEP
ncbi:MAG: hypothetical protein R3E68_16015 [Burkholderiaceae bacterium]